METTPLDSQHELSVLRALVAQPAAKLESQEAEVSKRDSIIGLLRAQLELLRHRQHGASSEKIERKIEQFELMLEELEASRAEAEIRSGKSPLPELDDAPDKPKRKPLPDGLPTEERVHAAPCNCPTCGGISFLKAADRVVQVMEHVPAPVKIVRHVEKRMVCRDCDTTVAGEMPTLPIERGKPGPGLLAHIMVAKFDDHIPLYRLSEMYDRLGIDISRSVMAEWVGRPRVRSACTARLANQGPYCGGRPNPYGRYPGRCPRPWARKDKNRAGRGLCLRWQLLSSHHSRSHRLLLQPRPRLITSRTSAV